MLGGCGWWLVHPGDGGGGSEGGGCLGVRECAQGGG